MTLRTTDATVANRAITVNLTCNLSRACVGAFLLCLPHQLCGAGKGLPYPYAGRLAGSDFKIEPKQSSAVRVALTSEGQSVLAQHHGYRAAVLVDLTDYGDASLPVPPALPPPAKSYYPASVRLVP
jgi:hypothetical protein